MGSLSEPTSLKKTDFFPPATINRNIYLNGSIINKTSGVRQGWDLLCSSSSMTVFWLAWSCVGLGHAVSAAVSLCLQWCHHIQQILFCYRCLFLILHSVSILFCDDPWALEGGMQCLIYSWTLQGLFFFACWTLWVCYSLPTTKKKNFSDEDWECTNMWV